MSLSDAHYFEEMGVKKYEEIRVLLDTRENKDKIEGMKRLLAMISIGRDASSFFPDVVKCVVCNSLEVKKLVYMFLTHYAEAKSNEALLTINTFQKDLSDSNQVIRSSALRVMTSIRVPIIAQLQVMAVKQCVRDSSPYVRKAAAHATAKVFALDKEQKEPLIDLIQTLLQDNSTLVIGSAVAAWQEVCPERFDLLHPNIRKFCRLCADTDEWAQIVLLNLFVRYGRHFFLDPNVERFSDKEEDEDGEKKKKKKKKKAFYSDSDSSSSSDSDSSDDEGEPEDDLDPDHALILSSSLPLLRSRNAGVVVAVVTLYHYLAPHSQVEKAAKSMVRVLKTSRETQYLVLINISTLVHMRPKLFDSFAKEFFLRASEPSCTSLIKLDILANLVNDSNATIILKEFNAYLKDTGRDPELTKATIQAIGRCAGRLPSLTDSCLRGLMALISANKNEDMVAESVVVVRGLVQRNPEKHVKVIKMLARQLQNMKDPRARASTVWLIGQYYSIVPKVAPDALRTLAQSFKTESSQVKLQVLNLGCKLMLHEPDTCGAMFRYLLELAKYDLEFDIRDKARMLRGLLLDSACPEVKGGHEALFLSKREWCQERGGMFERGEFTINTLSHAVGHTVTGYEPIPDFSDDVPDSSIREPVVPKGEDGRGGGGRDRDSAKKDRAERKKLKSFYSGSDTSGSDSDSDDSSGSGSDSSSSSSGSSSGSGGSDSDSSDSSDSDGKRRRRGKKAKGKKRRGGSSSSSSSSGSSSSSSSGSSDDDSSGSSDDSSDSEDERRKKAKSKAAEKAAEKERVKREKQAEKERLEREKKGKAASKAAGKKKGKSGAEAAVSLIDLGDSGGDAGGRGGSSRGLLDTPASPGVLGGDAAAAAPSSFGSVPLQAAEGMIATTAADSSPAQLFTVLRGTSFVKADKLQTHTLLHFANGGGLNVTYVFSRESGIYSQHMTSIRLSLKNTTNQPLASVRVGATKLEAGMDLQPFSEIVLGAGQTQSVNLYIDFAGKIQDAAFELTTDKGSYPVSLAVTAGEIIVPATMDKAGWEKLASGLKGMHEHKQKVDKAPQGTREEIEERILTLCNMAVISSEDTSEYLFAAVSVCTDASPVLIALIIDDAGGATLRGHSEKTLLARQLVKAVKEAVIGN